MRVVLIYDGDCGICRQSASWSRQRLPAGAEVVPWQSIDDLSDLGLTVDDVTTAAYWVDADGGLHRGHRAVARTLVAVGGAWSLLGRALLLPTVAPFAGVAYRLIADNRDRIPANKGACATGDS